MARTIGPVCRMCRRECRKFLRKGDRRHTERCSGDERPYPHGQHGQARPRVSNYGAQLREKQKVKRMYGLMERQFAGTVSKATRMRGRSGTNLLQLLERRLDNVVFRLGFATSRAEARQLVRHGHFQVNGRKTSTPSFLVKAGHVITLRESSREIARIVGALDSLEGRALPAWLEIDKGSFQGIVKTLPSREDITLPIEEQLIVELYSRY